MTLLGGVEQLFCRLAGYAGEVDLQVSVGEEFVHSLAVSFPKLLVPFGDLTEVAGAVGVVGQQAER